jgi:sensor histidine kinase YesM
MKESFLLINRKRILIHATVIVSIITLLSFIMAISSGQPLAFKLFLNYFLQASTSISLLIVPPIYLNIYWIIPEFLIKKRYAYYVLILIVLIVFCGAILAYVEPWIDRHWFDQPQEESNISNGITGMMFIIFISTLINLSYKSFGQLSKIKQIENEQLHLELSSLKNQINPHFFFNTLNNLYALSLEKSDETPLVILKLSEMMRYTIYDCKESEVSISGEISYLENFIALQKVRHHKRGIITLKNEISNQSVKVAPMILIVFLENAFKHGFDMMDKDAIINLNLKMDGNNLHFYIENNFTHSENKDNIGIGLENVKRRLSLIYPKTHELKIVQNSNLFCVDLKLYLS